MCAMHNIYNVCASDFQNLCSTAGLKMKCPDLQLIVAQDLCSEDPRQSLICLENRIDFV